MKEDYGPSESVEIGKRGMANPISNISRLQEYSHLILISLPSIHQQ